MSPTSRTLRPCGTAAAALLLVACVASAGLGRAAAQLPPFFNITDICPL
jgi:hypothetical protein